MFAPALQLYTIRHALEASLGPTLDRVRAAGFECVEVAPPPPNITHDQLARELKARNFTAVALHTDLPVGGAAQRILDVAAAYGCRNLIWHGWPRDPDVDTLDGWRRLADAYAQAAANAARHQCHFGLHNHWWECEPIAPGGAYRYQLLDQWLPHNIFFEVDVYWAQTAGLNPATLLKELSHRIRFVHLKDGPAQHGKPMTALGEGCVDIAGLVRQLPSAVQPVIELDECDGDPLAAAARSRQYLKDLNRS